MPNVGYIGAFLGGLLSFLSPCILPLIPSYVSYITGISFKDIQDPRLKIQNMRLTISNSIAFVMGFSAVFILLGVSSSFIGAILSYYYDYIRIIGGIIIIVLGLYVMGVIRIGILSREKKFHLHSKPHGYAGSFIVGITFGAGWTPCIGPILGSILLIASTSGSLMYGFKLLLVYSLGLAIPFLITSLAINTFIGHLKGIQRYMRVILILSGLLLIGFGIILLTDSIPLLLGYMPDLDVERLLTPR
ncbi:MAG: cytochrome c biogenesis protein CcdA [Thermodesulfovibrionia bacterium]